MSVHFGTIFVPKKGLKPSQERDISDINNRPLYNLFKSEDKDAWVYQGGLPSRVNKVVVSESEVHLADELTRLQVPYLYLPGNIDKIIKMGVETVQSLSQKLTARAQEIQKGTQRLSEEYVSKHGLEKFFEFHNDDEKFREFIVEYGAEDFLRRFGDTEEFLKRFGSTEAFSEKFGIK